MGPRRSPESRSRGHSEITDQDSSCRFARFGMKPRPRPEMVNSAQTPQRPQAYKSDSRRAANQRVTRAKEKYETSMKDKIKSGGPRGEGTNQGSERLRM